MVIPVYLYSHGATNCQCRYPMDHGPDGRSSMCLPLALQLYGTLHPLPATAVVSSLNSSALRGGRHRLSFSVMVGPKTENTLHPRWRSNIGCIAAAIMIIGVKVAGIRQLEISYIIPNSKLQNGTRFSSTRRSRGGRRR